MPSVSSHQNQAWRSGICFGDQILVQSNYDPQEGGLSHEVFGEKCAIFSVKCALCNRQFYYYFTQLQQNSDHDIIWCRIIVLQAESESESESVVM